MSAPLPQYQELLLPTLRAVDALGGSGSIREIVEQVALDQPYDEEQWSVLHNGGPTTEIGYRIAWARTYLKGMGLLTNSERGVWAATEDGMRLVSDSDRTEESRLTEIRDRRAEYIARVAEARRARGSVKSADVDGSDGELDGEPEGEHSSVGWKEQLIARLTESDPTGASFERLTKRLLREADFESVTVTGRSGDQGIDGVGVYRLGLISFPVFFQCKRYSGAVNPHDVRDFRGAMAGRGEKGLLITTGRFTAEARREANRDGATPIELIDGDRLCDLLQQYSLGVRTVVRQVQDVSIDPEFFDEY